MTSEEIRKLRKRLGLSQRELALRVGYLTAAVVYKWERGLSRPSGPAVVLLRQLQEEADAA